MRRLFLAILAFFLVAAAPVTLAPQAEARWIDFASDAANHILFRARIDGREVVALLDTGVSHSVLARRSRAVVPGRLVAAGEAVAIGGGVPIERMTVGRIELGGVLRDGGTLLVADLGIAAIGGGSVDLLVGQDLLDGIAIDIDYPARRFRFVRSGRLPFGGEAAPLTVMPGRGLPLTAITIGGRRLAPVLVDTGDGAAATLGTSARGVLTDERTTSGIAWGLGGAVETEVAVAPTLSLGEARARDVEVRFEDADGLATRLGLAGRIGAALLSRYRVLIDPGAGRMVLRADEAAAVPARSTSGLLVGIGNDRLRVLHVMRGGPAAAAGWHAGEEICAVDGQRVAAGYAASPLARWTVGAPGTTVALTPCGGAPRLLRLTRFY